MVEPLMIGNLKLGTNLLLAPMSGYCDLAFRLVARACGGLGLGVTDLLCPAGVLRENRKSMELAQTCAEDSPVAMQLYGSLNDPMEEAARWAEEHGADVVDLNMGCPADKITKRDGGSKLLCTPDATLAKVEKIKGALRRVPLTVKLRLGWDDSSIVAPYMARRLEEIGVAMVTVHGRTTAMGFSGKCRLEGIGEVVAAVKGIPVVGNGDVRTPGDAKRMMEATGCKGVMIGRAALGAPWVFRDTWSYLRSGVIPAEPTLEEKCQMMRDHFYNMIRYRSRRAAILEFRKRVSWYAKHLHPCSELRQTMRFVRSEEEFEGCIREFLAWRAEDKDRPRISTNKRADSR